MGTKPLPAEAPLNVRVKDTNAHFRRLHEPGMLESGLGKFFLLLEITAADKDIYVPLSLASGKKPTGFVYEIEGTKEGVISTTDISCEGDGISQVTLGTILYCKIPAMATAGFRLFIETRGALGGEYHVVVSQINYKHDPRDARYVKAMEVLESASVKFD